MADETWKELQEVLQVQLLVNSWLRALRMVPCRQWCHGCGIPYGLDGECMTCYRDRTVKEEATWTPRF